MITHQDSSLTGVWHGLYSYPEFAESVYFVATLIQSGGSISGTIHEAEIGRNGAPLTLYASVSGSVDKPNVDFAKTYDGSGGWSHTVTYSGLLNDDWSEIDGTWTIQDVWSGRFLMIRSRLASEAKAREVFEKV
jgi:hypothetical protein